MTETFTDNGALANWSLPQCPFGIEYSRKALDDIRLAVVDAFFSLPRGGAEIGGILLGKFDENRLQILDYAPIECEHAFGPAFTLSPTDQTRLGEMLRQSYPGGLRPVGWYHSHTRSEISLCDSDLDIHNRYFPERWQVALVLRPSTLQPTQAGFFFRESDGSILSQSSYQEFVLEALPALPVASAGPEAVPGPMRETEPEAVVLTLPSAQAEEPAEAIAESAPLAEEPRQPLALLPAVLEFPAAAQRPAPEAEPEHEAAEVAAEPILNRMPEPLFAHAPEDEPFSPHANWAVEEPRHEEQEPETREPADTAPAFGGAVEESAKPQRRWIGIAAGLVAGLTLGLFAGQARSHSRPAPPPAPVAAPTPAPVAPAPEDAALRKQNDELSKQVADLSQQNTNLKKENADLTNQQASLAKQDSELNKQQGEAGKRQAELRQQRDDLVKQTAKLKADLTAQTARAQTLQQQVEDLRRQQQRKRLSIQSSDPLP